MAKSFCNGCKHWEFCSPGYGDPGFYYCAKLHTNSLLKRKERCGGNLKEKKEDTIRDIIESNNDY